MHFTQRMPNNTDDFKHQASLEQYNSGGRNKVKIQHNEIISIDEDDILQATAEQ